MKREIGSWAKVIFICGFLIWVGLFTNLILRPGENRQAREQEKKGDVFFNEGKPERALVCWRRAIALAPGQRAPYEKISAYYLLQGQWLEARKVIESGLTQLPSCANLYFNLGLSYYFSGDYVRARESFRRVTQLDSYYPDAHYFLGLIYRQEGKPAEAEKEFIREVNLDPTSRRAWKEIRK
ncbi:MAG: tetratricopeptide repeat protein [Candidatus Omnitrophota bacterium]